MCLQQLIIKVSASYNSLIDTDDPAKEMMKKSIVLINNHRTKKRNPVDSLVCNLDLTHFASFLRTDFAWRGLWADVQRQVNEEKEAAKERSDIMKKRHVDKAAAIAEKSWDEGVAFTTANTKNKALNGVMTMIEHKQGNQLSE
jgi:curved DNA-binding protein CbpA